MASTGPLARSAVVFVCAVLVHAGLLSQMTPAGVIVDLFVLLAVAGGILGGRYNGASFGAGCGLASDLIVHTPFGMCLLVLTLLGYLCGLIGEQLGSARRVARAMTASLLAAGGIGLFWVAGWLMDLEYVTEAPIGRIAIVTAIAALLAQPLLERLVVWALVIYPQTSLDRVQGPYGG